MKKGIKLTTPPFESRTTDVIKGCKIYPFPQDMQELLYLEVRGLEFFIDNRTIVLVDEPYVDRPGKIKILYTKKKP